MALRHCSTLRSHLLDERRRYHTQQVIWRWRPSQMTATQRCTEMEGRRRWLRLLAGLKELLPGHWRISSFEPRNIGCVLPGMFRWRIYMYLLGCDTACWQSKSLSAVLIIDLAWPESQLHPCATVPGVPHPLSQWKLQLLPCDAPPLSLSTPSESSSVSPPFAASRSLRRTRHRN